MQVSDELRTKKRDSELCEAKQDLSKTNAKRIERREHCSTIHEVKKQYILTYKSEQNTYDMIH